MNNPAQPKLALRISAKHVGPIMKLDESLSSQNQNLIFARNGTGKSFIARALRLLDPTAYPGVPPTERPNLVVSDESTTGEGSFELYEGPTCIASLKLNTHTKTLSSLTPEYIFHVFTEDYVDEQLRNKLEALDGEITHEIIIGRENVEINKKETALSETQEQLARLHQDLRTTFVRRRDVHKTQFAIFASLGAFRQLDPTVYFQSTPYALNKASSPVATLLSQFNTFKGLPADPPLPSPIQLPTLSVDIPAMRRALTKITSPSTVAAEIKKKIQADPTFFATGLKLFDARSDECPFCTQTLRDLAFEAINAYTRYFDDAEAREKENLSSIVSSIDSTRRELERWTVKYHSEHNKYEKLRGYFPSYSDKQLSDITELVEGIHVSLASIRDRVALKANDLTAGVEYPPIDIDGTIDKLSVVVAQNDSLMKNLADAVGASENERKAIQRASCESFEKEFFEAHKQEIEDIKQLERDSQTLSAEIAQLKLAHGNATPARDRVVRTFSTLIKRFFGDKYSFNEETFRVRRNNQDMRRGSDRTLSDGEKAAMAFCYFLAQIHL